MKKLLNYSLMMVLAIVALTSCSSSGSKEIALNDVRCNVDYISVVPGNYTIDWKTEHQGNNDFVTAKITLKIKVEKQVEYIGKDRSSCGLNLSSYDANGNAIPGIWEVKSSDYTDSNGSFVGSDPEAVSAAIDALTKPVGTVSEITFSTLNSNGDAEKVFRNIENISISGDNYYFKIKGE